MTCLSLTDLLALEALLVTLIGVVGAIILPELRQRLGLSLISRRLSPSANVLFVLWMLLFIIALSLVLSVFLCRRVNTTDTGPTAAPTPTPPPVVGPIEIHTPVKIDGSEFTLYKFSPEYHWKKGKVEAEFNKEVITGEQMISYLKDVSGTIADADAIICVGTASADMEDDEPGEEGRALLRAQQLDTWIGPAISATKRDIATYQLNLGHYRADSDSDSQRPILLVKVKKLESRRSIDELLSPRNKEVLQIKLKEQFKFSFDSYSMFDLHKRT